MSNKHSQNKDKNSKFTLHCLSFSFFSSLWASWSGLVKCRRCPLCPPPPLPRPLTHQNMNIKMLFISFNKDIKSNCYKESSFFFFYLFISYFLSSVWIYKYLLNEIHQILIGKARLNWSEAWGTHIIWGPSFFMK